MEEFKKSGEAVLRDLKTNSEGLSGQEAAQSWSGMEKTD